MEGPRLAAFPFEVVAAKVVTEELATIGVEEVPGANEVEGGVGRAENTSFGKTSSIRMMPSSSISRWQPGDAASTPKAMAMR